MGRRGVVVGVGALALGGLLVWALVLRGGGGGQTAAARDSGRALSEELHAALGAARGLSEPFRCARASGLTAASPETADTIGGLTVSRSGAVVTVTGHRGGAVVIGVIADARGATAATLAQLAAVREELTKAGAAAVLSLGGMGRTQAEIAGALGALASGAPFPVIALPGDRESVPAHRAAVASVTAAPDTVVFDGSEVRFIDIGDVSIGTLPGMEQASQLVAGSDGCRHAGQDANALARALSARTGTRVWASYAPPRQRGPAASDVAFGGVHVGERSQTAAVAASGARLAIHAMVDEAALKARTGRADIAGVNPVFLAAGAIEAMASATPGHHMNTGSALIVTIGDREIRWRRLHRQQMR